MKEITLFTSARSVDATFEKLGALGVVDIKHTVRPESATLERLAENISQVKEALQILEQHNPPNHSVGSASNSVKIDPKQVANRIVKSKSIIKRILAAQEELLTTFEFYDTWGTTFEASTLKELRGNHIFLRLYTLEKSQLANIPEGTTVEIFPERKGEIPVAMFSQDKKERLPFKEVTIPELSFAITDQIRKRKARQHQEVGAFLTEQLQHKDTLESYLADLEDRQQAQQAQEGMGTIEGKVQYLQGFIPKDEVETFKHTANAEAWGYVIKEPENLDQVPVYIKNPKWISIINPLMKFIDIVPGYKEIDVSIYFLVAFALFFAMLVGDAGYGLIFLLLAIILRKKMAPQLRTLLLVLSGATVIWGVLSGTYFGAVQIAQLPFLKDLVIPNIASFGVDNINFMMHLSFLIGALHLTVAHGIRAMQFSNSIKALSEIGWICLVWGLFFVTEQLVLGKPAPSWYMALFGIGAGLVIFCSKESTSLAKSMVASMANLPLSLISGFSDIVSYVRLFAVGMATAAVAASFNTMILPNGISGFGILEFLMAAIALLLGHGLNIALALMAVMVHGIRLNMLEFAAHLGVEFTGEAYKPFKLNRSKTLRHYNNTSY